MTIDLNTMNDPRSGFMDETPCVRCGRCRHTFLLGYGMDQDPVVAAITEKHIELCEGDAAVTLMKVEQAYKAGWRPHGSGGLK